MRLSTAQNFDPAYLVGTVVLYFAFHFLFKEARTQREGVVESQDRLARIGVKLNRVLELSKK